MAMNNASSYDQHATYDLSNILIGTASAAMQIEGSMPPSNWSMWAAAGKVVDGTGPDVTTDHWNRWREDNQIMADLGLQIARISVEWARVEPEPGHIDEAVLARYREEILDLKSRGIKPLVTLHHFGHPQWFEERGAFTKAENVPDFFFVLYSIKTDLPPPLSVQDIFL